MGACRCFGWACTDPESIFVESACEYGIAVQGDGFLFWVTVVQDYGWGFYRP